MLGQKLERAVVDGTAISVDTGTEITEWVKKKRFPGKVSVLPQDAKAVADKPKEHRINWERSRSVRTDRDYTLEKQELRWYGDISRHEKPGS